MKKMITLIADKGMILTNGTDYGTTVSLAIGVSDDEYREIPMQEYEELMQEQNPIIIDDEAE